MLTFALKVFGVFPVIINIECIKELLICFLILNEMQEYFSDLRLAFINQNIRFLFSQMKSWMNSTVG